MRILWVNETARFAGGAEAYIADTVTRLAAQGLSSSLVYGVGGGSDPAFTRLFDGAFPRVDLARQVADLQPDVVFAHQLGGPEVVAALGRLPVPTAHFLHDHHLFCLRQHKYRTVGLQTCRAVAGLGCYPCLGFLGRGGGRLPIRFRGLGALAALQRAERRLDALVVASEYLRAHACQHGFDPSRVHVLPLYADVPATRPLAARDPGLFLFVGTLVRGKGVDVFLEAVALTPGARALVLGGGRQEDRFRALAARRAIGDRVTFAGRVPRAELDRHYRRAAALVIASREPETFGLVGLEALAHETPVVATRVGAIPEWLTHGENGLLVPPNDPAAMAAAFAWVLDHPEAARALGARGRDRVARRFGAERHVAGLLALFRDLMLMRVDA